MICWEYEDLSLMPMWLWKWLETPSLGHVYWTSRGSNCLWTKTTLTMTWLPLCGCYILIQGSCSCFWRAWCHGVARWREDAHVWRQVRRSVPTLDFEIIAVLSTCCKLLLFVIPKCIQVSIEMIWLHRITPVPPITMFVYPLAIGREQQAWWR